MKISRSEALTLLVGTEKQGREVAPLNAFEIRKIRALLSGLSMFGGWMIGHFMGADIAEGKIGKKDARSSDHRRTVRKAKTKAKRKRSTKAK